MEISKELLSEVLDREAELAQIHEKDSGSGFIIIEVEIKTKAYLSTRINIHQLTHKCKEWAYKKGWCLKSFLVYDYDSWTIEIDYKDDFDFEHLTIFDGISTEPEAIFKACEWILEKEFKND